MFCNGCGTELPSDANFCQKCGRATVRLTLVPRPPLERPRQGRKIAGVCAGVGRHFGIDPIVVRILWVLSIFVGLGGVVAYIVAWILMPEEPLVTPHTVSTELPVPANS